MEKSSAYPQDVEKLTARISQFPEQRRSDYAAYLEERVFQVMAVIRPWGLNGETAKLLILDALAEEELTKGLPAPHEEDVEAVWRSCWKMDNVQKTQRESDLSLARLYDGDKKPAKAFYTNSMPHVEARTFVDIGADVTVLREVAVRLDGMEMASKLTDAFDEQVAKKYPSYGNSVIAEDSVSDLIAERQKQTFQTFSEDEPVDPNRWEWLKEKQPDLRHHESVEILRKVLFGGDDDKALTDSADSMPAVRRTRNHSISSVSSSGSRQTSVAAESAAKKMKGSGGTTAQKRSSASKPAKTVTPSSSKKGKK
ncbi:hypothetical protein BV898_02963 [Hypsibius exemplaris]|uniref:Uncharacterized protein n=1 Tax=Hypsibius exemplaris TaxID=2072580 RepID=A0A1W0X6V5_HYPEX|nr:hypothetical protein BV898_02963 [Hypsibius exemplaris]